MIVLNNWCYLGTAINEDELYELAGSEQVEFDLDIYKLLKKALAGPFKQQVIKLRSTVCGRDTNSGHPFY